MRSKRYLNGCDYLMLAFDYDLRRQRYAGNSCQILLELGASIEPDSLNRRLTELLTQHPLLASRPAGLILPYWKPRRATPAVRRRRDEPGLREQLFNEPLDTRHGELLRFDLIERSDRAMDLVFTWAHALMDARAAEHFLMCIGSGDLSSLSPAPSVTNARPISEQWRKAWQATCHVEQLAKVPPLALRPPDRSVPSLLKYRVEKFSDDETARIRENAARFCGFLNHAQFDAAASLMELHHLHQRVGSGSPSYCFPLPVGLRPKGSVEPLFSNQVAMLMLQFFPEQLDSLPTVVAALKTQTEQALRNGLLENGIMLAEISRYVPLPACLAIMRYSLGGELASLFYGDAGNVNSSLTEFLGAPVNDVAHVGAVTQSPGLGVIFCRFRNQLRLVVIHAAPMLKDDEATEFATNLRRRLLQP